MPRLALALILALAAPANAQTHTHAHGPMPSEAGQDAFGAVAEIVALLQADPETDWGRVDIAALRDHLRDMDLVMTGLEVTVRELPDGAAFEIPTAGPAGEAALRMVPAHAPVLAAERGWQSEVDIRDGRILWTVRSDGDTEMIRALGFYGLMATGAHHQPHHLAIATGQPMH